MEPLTLYGHIDEKGVMTLQNRQRLKEWARLNPGKNISIKFSRKGTVRSSPQNRWYWGCLIREITIRLRELGHQWLTDEDTHLMMKLKFNYERVVSEEGEVLELPKSTTGLTTTEFADYCENIRQWAADFLHIDIPDPNTQTQINF